MNQLTLDPLVADDRLNTGEERRGFQSQPIILHYLNIAKRWKWLVLGSIVTAAVIGLIATLLMTPQYTAGTTLDIKRENDRIVNVQGVEPETGVADNEFYQTQVGLLKSRSLAERVASDLRLHENAGFFDAFGEKDMADQIRAGGMAAGSQRQERIRRAGVILLENVEVSAERMSRLMSVYFTSPDPQLSMNVPNAWARAFIDVSLQRRYDATSYARDFLEERLGQLRGRLQDSERALVSYAANQRIINIPTSTSTGQDSSSTERPLVAEDLTAINRELNEAIAARVSAQSRLRGVSGVSAEALANTTVADLRSRRASLAAEHARLLVQFEPDYPPARALAEQVADLDRSIQREEARVRGTLQAVYDAAVTRENMLRQRVTGLESDLLNLRGRTIQYNIFQRDVDTNRQLYDALLQRYKEIGVAGGVGVNNISIVDTAQLPEIPSSPNLLVNLLISIFLGALAGAALALALEQVDQTISDPRELEAALGIPLLGAIPKSRDENPVGELEDPKTPLVEAYLSAQTRLAFTTDHGVPRTLAVTSTRPGEGKSTTAYALARQLARATGRVLLIDGDMRSPSLHGLFDLSDSRGLSNYLAGDDELSTMIHPVSTTLSVLPSGPVPPNAAELLTGDRIRTLLNVLSADFDHIIIDAPPVMGLADTPLISSKTEGVIFVVESHATPATMATVAVARLRESKAHLLGALLTKFEAKKAQYGYGYGYEYGYGYGKLDNETPERA
jgi:succinoglycan biosynthesis transport protein ExoP